MGRCRKGPGRRHHCGSFAAEVVDGKLNIGHCKIWMIGDDPVADIQGAKEHLGAVTLQKKHTGGEIGRGKWHRMLCLGAMLN